MTAENRPEIIATTRRSWRLMDSREPEFESFIDLPIGLHRLEIKPSPYGDGDMWFMVEGTHFGKPMQSWLVFQDSTDDFQVIIEGSTPPPLE